MNNNIIVYDNIIVPLCSKLDNEDFVVDKSGARTVEIINCNIPLDPTNPIIEIGPRKTPVKYCEAELKWYNSESLSAKEIAKSASIWNEVCSKYGLVNSNYGWCVYSDINYSQYDNVLKELTTSPESRRATMIYNRPSMWYDYNKNGMNDFICTFSTQHFIRDNKLITIVLMRSNDVIFGFFNDFYWQCHIHNNLIADLNSNGKNEYSSGKMYWQANSMHIYGRHFDLLKRMAVEFLC